MTYLKMIVVVIHDAFSWGSVAEWVGGLGTVGALTATIWLVLRQRQRDTSQVARELGAYFDVIDFDGKKDATLRFQFHNMGPLPIYWVTVLIQRKGHEEWESFSATGKGVPSLVPGHNYVFTLPADPAMIVSSFTLDYRDRNGNHWLRSVVTGRFKSRREIREMKIPSLISQPLTYVRD